MMPVVLLYKGVLRADVVFHEDLQFLLHVAAGIFRG